MANVDGQPDHALIAPRTVGLSPKTTAAAVAGTVMPLLLLGVDSLLGTFGDASVYAGLPAPWPVVISAAVSGLSAALAAYRARPGRVA